MSASATATRSAESLSEIIAEALDAGDCSIRDLVERTDGNFSAAKVEAEIWKSADPILTAGDGVRTFRRRMASYESWPVGIPPEVVAVWEGLPWRKSAMFGPAMNAGPKKSREGRTRP